MSKYDIGPQFECQNRILNVKIRYFGPISNFKIVFCISKYDIRPQLECQNRILNVTILYSASVGMSKYDTRLDF